jgi:leucyl aminopeptidase (aminopeptidase T)
VKLSYPLAAGALVLAGAVAVLQRELPALTGPGSPSTLAQRIVRTSAGVRENDLVQLSGTPADVPLLEDLAVEVRKLGGHPLITLTSDKLRRRFVEDVPAKFDAQPPKFDLALAGLCDVQIQVEATDVGALVGVPPARMAAQQKAAEGVNKKLLDRNVRVVSLGNGLYPTAMLAKRFGMAQAQLRKVYEAGLEAGPAALTARGTKIQKSLGGGKELTLRSDDGTDVKMQIARRPVLLSDGVLTPEKEKKGGAACSTWLPAGEVYLAPVAGTAEGTVFAPVVFWEGQEIRNLKLTFKAGKLTAMTAASGDDRLQAVYKAHSPGKEAFGAVDIGINPGVRAPAGSKLVSFVAEGTVTVALGNNAWAGGDVGVAFGLSCHLPRCTLSVDGKPLVERGKLAP